MNVMALIHSMNWEKLLNDFQYFFLVVVVGKIFFLVRSSTEWCRKWLWKKLNLLSLFICIVRISLSLSHSTISISVYIWCLFFIKFLIESFLLCVIVAVMWRDVSEWVREKRLSVHHLNRQHSDEHTHTHRHIYGLTFRTKVKSKCMNGWVVWIWPKFCPTILALRFHWAVK